MGKANVAQSVEHLPVTDRSAPLARECRTSLSLDLDLVENLLYRLKALAYQFEEFNDGLLEFAESGLEPPGEERRARANARHHLYDLTTEALHREIDAVFEAIWPRKAVA
jgi:hypothetical protein